MAIILWTEAEDNLIRKHWPIMNDRQLAGVITGRTAKAIRSRRAHLKLTGSTTKVWTKKEDAYIKENYIVKTDTYMGSILKRSPEAVRWRRCYLGYDLPDKVRKARQKTALKAWLERPRKRHPFPGASLYTITYFAIVKRNSKNSKIFDKSKRTLQEILEDVANAMQQPIEKITSRLREREIVFCRQLIAYIAYSSGRYSLVQLADFLNYSNHTSVMHGITVIKEGIASDDASITRYWYTYLHNTKLYKAKENAQ